MTVQARFLVFSFDGSINMINGRCHFYYRLLCQIVFFVCDIYIRNGAVSSTMSLSDITPDVWAVGLAAPILFVIVNELVKHREIK